jgi:hypothetical protein
VNAECMPWVFSDGGRSAAGFKGSAGDCLCRAVAIASGRPYAVVYADLARLSEHERSPRRGKKSHPRLGVHCGKAWVKEFMGSLGASWVPTMQIGSGCKVHLRANELPAGRLVAMLSRHAVAVVDGVIYDVSDPSRNGSRCVYGFWRFPT